MRNFFLFIQRYAHFFLFIILESVSFYIIYQFHVYHHAVVINSANSVNGYILDKRSAVTRYFSLAEENKKLMYENTLLRKHLSESYILDQHDTLVNKDTTYKQRFTYIPGNVIQNTTDQANNYLTIDRGASHGVRKNMGVIGPQGIVGIVISVSENFSIAMSVLNSKFRVTPKISNNSSIGKLVWPGSSPYFAEIQGINKFNTIRKGDRVTTSPYSSLFPENVMIGRIVDVRSSAGNAFLNVKIRLSTDFTKIRSVYIINNLQMSELKRLEEQLSNGD